MPNALIRASSNVIFQNGSDILLIKRSSRSKAWPNFWAFPGGKVDNDEFFRETAKREIEEEIGIHFNEENIINETIIMNRTVQGTKLVYFCLVDEWDGIPEICERNLASDMAWFPLSELPEPFIPHHKKALEAFEKNIAYQEFNTAP